MARILIEPAKARIVLGSEESLESSLRAFSQDVDSVRRGLRYKIAGEEQISARLKEAAAQLTKEAASARAMHNGLDQVIQRYEQTENGNRDRASSAEHTSIQQNSGGGSNEDSQDERHDGSLWKDLLSAVSIINMDWLLPVGPCPNPYTVLPAVFAEEFRKAIELGLLKASGEVEEKHEEGIDLRKLYKDEDHGIFKKIDDWEDDHQRDLGDGKHYYKDLKTGKITAVNLNNEKEKEAFYAHNKGTIPVDLKLAGIGASGSIAVIDQDWKGSTGWAGHEGNVSLAKLEGHADAYLGLGLACAEIGAGFTAFSAEEKGYLGDENTQIYGKAGVEVGKADAKAGFSAGFVDKEGNINPSLYAGASAEAIGGEASVTLGGKAFGADVGLKGSVNYGIGAHANVGLHDGKISVDVGATLGVGVSVKLDIDVSGTIEGVCDAAGKVWSGVSSLFHW